MSDETPSFDPLVSRKQLVTRAGMGVGGLVLAQVLAGCGGSGGGSSSGKTLKIGFVSPRTGPAAGFGEGDGYVLGLARKAFDKGLDVGGTNYAIEIIAKD